MANKTRIKNGIFHFKGKKGLAIDQDLDVEGALDVNGAANVDGALTVVGAATITGALTATAGVQGAAVARTATADGLTTGIIPAGASFVAVTAGADANSIITLPTAAPVGTVIWAWIGATGHELRTTAASGETINNVDSDGTNELAIVATTLWRAHKVSSTAWIVVAWDELGAAIAALVPDAA